MSFSESDFMSIFFLHNISPTLLLRFTFGMCVYIVFDVMSLLMFKEGVFLAGWEKFPNSTFDFNFQSQDCLPNQSGVFSPVYKKKN